MEPYLRDLLHELHAWGRAHDEREPDHGRRMLNLRPETAQLVSILVRGSRRTRLLEFGTSNGYSTIWLAWSAAALGGRVISVDHSAEKLALADANLRRASLRDIVELRHGDAADVAAALRGPFDFVLFDSVRLGPQRPLQLLLPKLTPDALVLADNALSHPQDMEPYLSAIAAVPTFDHVVVPVGKGLSIAYQDPHRRSRRLDPPHASMVSTDAA